MSDENEASVDFGDGARGQEAPIKDLDYYLDDFFVVFQVEDTLFKVPAYRFTKESCVFAGMFAIPQPNARGIEGSSPENPIKLPPEVRKDDFRNLMKALYPKSSSLSLSWSKAQWLSILKLSTMWYFTTLREIAISELDRLNQLTAVEKVVLGRSVKVSKWVMDGFDSLVRRPDTISDDEANDIDLTTTIRLFRIRESVQRMPQSVIKRAGSSQIVGLVQSEFSAELSDIRSQEEGYGESDKENTANVQPPAPEGDSFYDYSSSDSSSD